MKKLFAVLLCAAVTVCAFSSCTAADDTVMRVAALKGPTAIGMAALIDAAPENVEFTLAASPDELVGDIVQGGFDIACVPTNLAANLYQKTGGEWQLAALNTMGVLYLVEAGESITSVRDLEGRTVFSSGKGSVPEFAMNYILEQNGVDAAVEYVMGHAEAASLLISGRADCAVLPQPFAAGVLMQNGNVRIALDLTEEWDKVSGGGSSLTMGCAIVRKAFAEEHPQALRDFFESYEASVGYVTDPANTDAAAEMTVSAGIIADAEIAKRAIPECGIVFITGEEMQRTAAGFFEVLYAADPQSVGGKLPDDGFYLNAD